MRVARTGRRHGVLVSETMSVIHQCAHMLIFLERFLLDHDRHPGTIWRGLLDRHVRLGTR